MMTFDHRPNSYKSTPDTRCSGFWKKLTFEVKVESKGHSKVNRRSLINMEPKPELWVAWTKSSFLGSLCSVDYPNYRDGTMQ